MPTCMLVPQSERFCLNSDLICLAKCWAQDTGWRQTKQKSLHRKLKTNNIDHAKKTGGWTQVLSKVPASYKTLSKLIIVIYKKTELKDLRTGSLKSFTHFAVCWHFIE
jgi:hypothetical protein